MSKICRAEALLIPEKEVTPEVQAAARLTGILAAKKAWELVPLATHIRPLKTDVVLEETGNGVRILVSVEAESGGEPCALLAAAAAGLTVNDMVRGTLETVRPLDQISEAAQSTPFPRKPAVAQVRRSAKPTPATLMGEVAAPRQPAVGNTAKREALRAFMLRRHLRATEWAKKAGVPAALIYGYLTGRTATIPADVLEKLAKVAKVSQEDMFKL